MNKVCQLVVQILGSMRRVAVVGADPAVEYAVKTLALQGLFSLVA